MPLQDLDYQRHPSFIEPLDVNVGSRFVLAAEADDGPFYEPQWIISERQLVDTYQSGPLVDRYRRIRESFPALDMIVLRMPKHDYMNVFRQLESYPFDIIYFDGWDITEKEKMYEFIDLCHKKEEHGDLIHGIFPYDEDENLAQVRDQIAALTFENSIETIEYGKYLSIVAAQGAQKEAPCLYGPLIIEQEIGTSPKNKQIDLYLEEEMTEEKRKAYERYGIVCFKKTLRRGVVCASSSCAVQRPGSPHREIANFRIVQFLIQRLSMRLEQFIGANTSMVTIQDIQKEIDRWLNAYGAWEVLREAQYAIAAHKSNGDVYVILELVPIFTTKHITSQAQVRIRR